MLSSEAEQAKQLCDTHSPTFEKMSMPASRNRSRSRSKRSSTNLSNLRLAPLSTKYSTTATSQVGSAENRENAPKTPSDEAFARQHSSYLQGKSAPTTPGILSRTSSRRSFSGGLSRRDDQIYGDEDDDEYTYSHNPAAFRASLKADGDIHRARSDATIASKSTATTPGSQHGHRRQMSGHGSGSNKQYRLQPRSKTGTSTPRALDQDDSWLSRTGSRTSALLQESKGQSWLSARDQPPPSSDDEDNGDDNYEEMAALSASTAKLERFASRSSDGDAVTPRKSRWGSRYGSRTASAKTSRYASPVGTRTPRPGRDASGYFDDHAASFSTGVTEMQERAFVDHPYPPEFNEDQAEVDRLSTNNSFGLGSVVDKLMNLRMFGAPADGGETTDDESSRDAADDTETEDEARERRAKEAQRRKIEKEKLVALPPAPKDGESGNGQVGGWQDAAWLLSVASKAMF